MILNPAGRLYIRFFCFRSAFTIPQTLRNTAPRICISRVMPVRPGGPPHPAVVFPVSSRQNTLPPHKAVSAGL